MTQPENTEDIGFSAESFRISWGQAMAGETLPLSMVWEEDDPDRVIVPQQIDDDNYELLVELLDRLIDQIGEDELHPLASTVDVIGVLIENYETKHVPELN